MAQDPKDRKVPSPPSTSEPSRSGFPARNPPSSPSVQGPRPMAPSFAVAGLDPDDSDLSEDDLRDIDALLGQQQDVTRQDIPAQNFKGLIDRYTAKKGG